MEEVHCFMCCQKIGWKVLGIVKNSGQQMNDLIGYAISDIHIIKYKFGG